MPTTCLRQSEIICRWGGEAFIILLKGTDTLHSLIARANSTLYRAKLKGRNPMHRDATGTMNTSTNAPQRCPACGASNACTLADPRTADQTCWCFSVSIDPAVIQALPQALRNKACLCPRCAGISGRLSDKPQP